MNRRGFLTTLLGTAAAMTLDPERLLWRPGAKMISIPAVVPAFPVQTLYWGDFLNPGYKIGDTIRVLPPFRFNVVNGELVVARQDHAAAIFTLTPDGWMRHPAGTAARTPQMQTQRPWAPI